MKRNLTLHTPLFRSAVEVVRKLKSSGYSGYLVGGVVRDLLLKREPGDIDIATDAHPDQIRELFPEAKFVGEKFGVALVEFIGFHFEVATFRKEGKYLDHRHPSHVTFGTLEEDCLRRDFTINSLYYDPLDHEVIDLQGGVEDLEQKRLRCVGDPEHRFNEDALRLLRAIRFAVRYDFEIEPQTWSAIFELAHTIEYISPERIRDELDKMLVGERAGDALDHLYHSGILHKVLPEVAAMDGVEQGKRFHPEGDVFVHTKLVVEYVEPRTSVNVWAALLHDVGKPVTFARNEQGKITFYQHEHVGCDLTQEILSRLKFPNKFTETVSQAVDRHMKWMNLKKMKKSTIRRFLSSETIDCDLALHRADLLGSCRIMETYELALQYMQDFEQSEEKLMPAPLINGRHLLSMGIEPGPMMGTILRDVQDRQLEGELNSEEEALRFVAEKYGSS